MKPMEWRTKVRVYQITAKAKGVFMKKNKFALIIFPIIFCVITACASQSGTTQNRTRAEAIALSGTFIYSLDLSITFNENNYTLTSPNSIFRGTYTIGSDKTFTLTGHESTIDWIRDTWTIIDSNTIRDSVGDLWRRQEITLSGAYYYNSDLYLTFYGGNFILTVIDSTEPGTFKLSENSIKFSSEMWGSDTWEIIDSNTLRDPENDLWRRPESAADRISYLVDLPDWFIPGMSLNDVQQEVKKMGAALPLVFNDDFYYEYINNDVAYRMHIHPNDGVLYFYVYQTADFFDFQEILTFLTVKHGAPEFDTSEEIYFWEIEMNNWFLDINLWTDYEDGTEWVNIEYVFW